MAVTQRGYPGALFLAANLLSFALHLPDRASWEAVIARIEEAIVEVEASYE